MKEYEEPSHKQNHQQYNPFDIGQKGCIGGKKNKPEKLLRGWIVFGRKCYTTIVNMRRRCVDW